MSKIVLYDNGEIEITLREVVFSIIILVSMIAVGMLISEKIDSASDDLKQEYEQAVKINNDTELFEYGMKTGTGNAFVFGSLSAVDTVSCKDITGDYAVIKKVTEKYTRHTRTVHHSDGKRSWTTTETYYTWDKVKDEEEHCNKVIFLGKEFAYGVIKLPEPTYLTTVKKSFISNTRYKYYVTDKAFTGTVYTTLKDNTITNCKIERKNLDDAIKSKIQATNSGKIFFVFAWTIITVATIYFFYSLQNSWLEDR